MGLAHYFGPNQEGNKHVGDLNGQYTTQIDWTNHFIIQAWFVELVNRSGQPLTKLS